MKHLILITFLTFGLATGFAQLPIKAPTRPTKTAPAAKPRPIKPRTAAKHRPIRRTSSAESAISVPSAIDLGLSVKWANYNLGANSPEDYGRYYGWADPSGHKTSIDDNNYPSANPPSDICGTSYDMARQNLGGSWRLPSKDEFKELVDSCTYELFTLNGVKGMKFTSKRNGNSIFLPFAGYRYGTEKNAQGDWGNYWSGTHYERNSDGAYYLGVYDNGYVNPSYQDFCHYGRSVRPVAP